MRGVGWLIFSAQWGIMSLEGEKWIKVGISKSKSGQLNYSIYI